MSVLPTVKVKQKASPLREITLFYSQPGGGKSYLAASCPMTPIFLDFDDGLKNLDVFRVDCTSREGSEAYRSMSEAVTELIATKQQVFKMVVIDTLTLALEAIDRHTVEQAGEKDINSGSLSYGKGIDKSYKAFENTMFSLKRAGYGVILLCHSKSIKCTDESGIEYNRFIPAMSDRLYIKVCAMTDHIVRLSSRVDVDENGNQIERRLITGTPSLSYDAKSRGGIYSRNMPSDWKAIEAAYALANKPKEKTETENPLADKPKEKQ